MVLPRRGRQPGRLTLTPTLTLTRSLTIALTNASPSPSQAGDTRQETTALQNMGTSLVMMGQLYEAARCYVRAFHLASAAEDPAAQVELLESLSWTYTELGYPQRTEPEF